MHELHFASSRFMAFKPQYAPVRAQKSSARSKCIRTNWRVSPQDRPKFLILRSALSGSDIKALNNSLINELMNRLKALDANCAQSDSVFISLQRDCKWRPVMKIDYNRRGSIPQYSRISHIRACLTIFVKVHHSVSNLSHFHKVGQNWQFWGKHSHKWSCPVLIDHIETLQAIFSGFCTMLVYRARYSKTWRIIPILRRTGYNGAHLPKIGHTRL